MDLSYQRIRQKNRDTTLLLIPLVAILAKFIHLYMLPDKYYFDSWRLLTMLTGGKGMAAWGGYQSTVDFYKTINFFNWTTLTQWSIGLGIILTPIAMIIISRTKEMEMRECIFTLMIVGILNIYVFSITTVSYTHLMVGKDIYEKLIKGYTGKQWGRPCDQLPSFIIKRLPVRFTYDNNYFNDKYQGIPVGGYTQIIEKMLDGIEVRLNEDFFDKKEEYKNIANKIVFTGMIDEYFDYCYGELEYRSLRFETEELEQENYQGNAVVNYTEYELSLIHIFKKVKGSMHLTLLNLKYQNEFII